MICIAWKKRRIFACFNVLIFDRYYLHPYNILMFTKGAKSSHVVGWNGPAAPAGEHFGQCHEKWHADIRLRFIKTTLRRKYLDYARLIARNHRYDILLTALTAAARALDLGIIMP